MAKKTEAEPGQDKKPGLSRIEQGIKEGWIRAPTRKPRTSWPKPFKSDITSEEIFREDRGR